MFFSFFYFEITYLFINLFFKIFALFLIKIKRIINIYINCIEKEDFKLKKQKPVNANTFLHIDSFIII